MRKILRTRWLAPLLIVTLGFLAYSNTFGVPFQFDDDAYVVNNPVIRTFHFFLHPFDIAKAQRLAPESFPVSLQFAFITRILGYLSLAVNYRLGGLDVLWYHVANLALHLLNGCLVFLVVETTLRLKPFSPDKDGASSTLRFLPLSTSLLFVVHPLQTHAVTYVTSRFVLLASCFSLLALLLYARSTVAQAGRSKVFYILAVASTAAAMLCKEFTFTLPFLIALYDYTFCSDSLRGTLKRWSPFAATILIIPALVFLQQGQLQALDATMRTITAADVSKISRWDYLLTQFTVIARYLRLLLLPVGQNIDHDFAVQHSLFAVPVLSSFLLLVALAGGGLYCYRLCRQRCALPELRLIGFGTVWFFVALSVESSILPLGELAAEYRVYLPSFGFFLAAAGLGHLLARCAAGRGATWIAVACSALVLVLVGTTYARNGVWRDEVTLWEDAASKSPARLRPHQNLGTYYSAQGRLAEAQRELLTALKIAPNNFEVHNNLGIVYRKMGDYSSAIREYTVASRIMPDDPMARYNIGNIYLAQGKYQLAVEQYRECLRLIPEYDELHNNLGIAYDKLGLYDDAIREFNTALGLNPQNNKVRDNLQITLSGRAGTAR